MYHCLQAWLVAYILSYCYVSVQIISYYQLSSPPYLPAPSSKNKIPLPQRQCFRRLGPQHFPISFNRIRLGIDLHFRHEVIPLHILLSDVPAVFHRFDSFLQPVFRYLAGRDARGADEGDGCGGDEGREHRTHDHGLHGRDGGVGVALPYLVFVRLGERGKEWGDENRDVETHHHGITDHPALDDHTWLRAEISRLPHHQVSQLTNFHTPDDVAHPLRHRRIDCVFADIALDAEIVGARPFVLLQGATLQFILMRRIPRAEDHFAAAAHGLRVRGHHADGAEVVEDVFGGDGLGADA